MFLHSIGEFILVIPVLRYWNDYYYIKYSIDILFEWLGILQISIFLLLRYKVSEEKPLIETKYEEEIFI